MVAIKEKKEFGEIKIDGEWLTYGTPKNILTDNGQEFHSYDYEKTQSSLCTNVKMAPAGQAWPKGMCERSFRQINEGVVHKLPATTLSNVLQSKGLNPEKYACVTLPMLRAFLEKWILDVYHKKPHRGLDGKSPEQIFHEKKLDPKLIAVPADMDFLKKSLGHWEKRVLSNKGIEYENLKYNNNTVEFQNYRHLNGERINVEIIVDKTNLGSIHLMTKEGKLFRLEEYSKLGYAEGISLAYHKKIREFSVKQLKSSDDSSWIDALHDLDAAILSVQEKSQKVKPKKGCGTKKAVQARVIDDVGQTRLTTVGKPVVPVGEDSVIDIEVNEILDLPTEYTY
jgi:putative transposase